MKTTALVYSLMIFLITGCQITGQTPIEVVDDYYQNGKFNGSILIARNDSVVVDTVFGYRDLKSKAVLKKETPVYIASLSKSMTATPISLLAEKGLVSFDDTAAKFVKNLPVYASKITIKQLLNHTSGIRDYENIIHKKGLTNNDVIDWLCNQDKLEFEPGTKFQYSNSGYIILSLIIEKVSRMTYAEFLKKNIFDPLSMNQTTVYESGTDIPDKAFGFNKNRKKDDYSLLTTGDGGIYSTAEDLFKLDQGLRTNQLLSEESTKRFYQTPILQDGTYSEYGAGWFIEKTDGHMIAHHTGGLAGFRSLFWRDLTNGNTIIALTNQGDAFPVLNFLKDVKKTFNN